MTGWFRCKQRAIVLNKDRLLGWHRPLVFCERKKPSCARIPCPTSNNSLRLPALVPWWMLPPKTRLALLFFAVTVNGWGFAFQVLSCIALRRVVCHQGDGAKKWHLQHLSFDVNVNIPKKTCWVRFVSQDVYVPCLRLHLSQKHQLGSPVF